ncbi:hypothetical protein AcV7_006641 [Taiwanofungus camphoratus]|nr:hypothetical protein AcV7_006641 [Antrodia cinnamomea]
MPGPCPALGVLARVAVRDCISFRELGFPSSIKQSVRHGAVTAAVRPYHHRDPSALLMTIGTLIVADGPRLDTALRP